jgi:hypothetical protein
LPDEQVGNAGLERDRKRERDRKEAVRKSPREKENEKKMEREIGSEWKRGRGRGERETGDCLVMLGEQFGNTEWQR